MTKVAFKKKTLFTSKLDLNLRKKLKNAASAETSKFQKMDLHLLILQSFDWLAAFHLELLQTVLFIAV
jgi:hypothetical protein